MWLGPDSKRVVLSEALAAERAVVFDRASSSPRGPAIVP